MILVDKPLDDLSDYSNYVGERPYEKHGYRQVGNIRALKPLGKITDDICKSCVHYYKNLHRLGLKRNPNVPTCKGHIARQYTDKDLEGLDEEDREEIKVISDPVLWAYREFGWEARFYQAEVLSCTSRFKAIRTGRRAGKTVMMAVYLLHAAVTGKDKKILIFSPSLNQIDTIFGFFDQFINESPNIKRSVARHIQNPFRIEFFNGSRITGYAVTPGNTQAVNRVRGLDADIIFIDECDFMDPEHIQVIWPIVTSRPDVQFIATSTPKGTKTHWYNWIVNKNSGFKEHRYLSSESPDWTEENEIAVVEQTTQANFSREYDGEFTVHDQSVFRKDLIDASIHDYSLSNMKPIPGATYLMGVDWNQVWGAHIVIVLWHDKLLRVIHKEVINPEDFKQTEATNAVIRLNDIWHPSCIFVDAGQGNYHTEILKKYGMSNPKSGLAQKVVAVDMGSNIEIKDPVTGGTEKKRSKDFMVQNAVKLLEDGCLILPKEEDTSAVAGEGADPSRIGIVQQMRNFEIVGFTATGKPKYSQGHEHTLTAYMLALMGFILKFTDLNKFQSYNFVFFMPGSGSLKPENTKDLDYFLSNVDRGLTEKTDDPSTVERKLDDFFVKKAGKNGHIPIELSERSKKEYNEHRTQIQKANQKSIRRKFDFGSGGFRKNF